MPTTNTNGQPGTPPSGGSGGYRPATDREIADAIRPYAESARRARAAAEAREYRPAISIPQAERFDRIASHWGWATQEVNELLQRWGIDRVSLIPRADYEALVRALGCRGTLADVRAKVREREAYARIREANAAAVSLILDDRSCTRCGEPVRHPTDDLCDTCVPGRGDPRDRPIDPTAAPGYHAASTRRPL